MAKQTTAKKKSSTKGKPTAKTATKKKTAKAAPKKTVAKKTVKKTAKGKSPDRGPVYILSIMALLAVIVLLLNKYYTGDKNVPVKKEKVTAGDIKKDKEEPRTAEKSPKAVKESEKEIEKPQKRPAEEKKAAGLSDVNVYLVKYDERTEKMFVVPMKRRVKTDTPVKGALSELLRGPSRSEENAGLLTAIPENLRIRNVRINGDTAVIDFNSAIEENATGNILLMRVDQIVYTATQFKGINRVLIKINGNTKSFLGSDGLSIGGPISRRK